MGKTTVRIFLKTTAFNQSGTYGIQMNIMTDRPQGHFISRVSTCFFGNVRASTTAVFAIVPSSATKRYPVVKAHPPLVNWKKQAFHFIDSIRLIVIVKP